MVPNARKEARIPADLRVVSASSCKGDGVSGSLCALLSDARVYCVGGNRYGQLGDGTTSDRLEEYRPVVDLEGVSSVQCGVGFACCALRANGTVACWGEQGPDRADYGRTPVEVPGLPRVVALGRTPDLSFVALADDGGAYQWAPMKVSTLGMLPTPICVMDPE
jgi:hypothetical protein